MPARQRIAILYPGELGTVLGGELAAAGHEIVTYVAERGARTRENAAAAGFIAAESLAAALRGADAIVSLVPPGEAVATAEAIAAALGTNAGAPLVLDLNSVAPATVREVAAIVTAAGARCLDGAIHGQAKRLRQKSVLLLSGPDAAAGHRLFDGILPVQVLGDRIGDASALKMCLGAFTKGLVALSLETIAAAAKIGRHKDLVACLSDFYPETTQVIARLLATYPEHVARRIQEVGEVRDWHREIGVVDGMADGTIEVLAKLAAAALDPTRPWPFDELIETVAASKAFDDTAT